MKRLNVLLRWHTRNFFFYSWSLFIRLLKYFTFRSSFKKLTAFFKYFSTHKLMYWMIQSLRFDWLSNWWITLFLFASPRHNMHCYFNFFSTLSFPNDFVKQSCYNLFCHFNNWLQRIRIIVWILLIDCFWSVDCLSSIDFFSTFLKVI